AEALAAASASGERPDPALVEERVAGFRAALAEAAPEELAAASTDAAVQAAAPLSCGPDTFSRGEQWLPGDLAVSPSGEFALYFDEYGLAAFQLPSDLSETGAFRGDVLAVPSGAAARLDFQESNGNVVARDAGGAVLAHAGLHTSGPESVRIGDNGNVVVRQDCDGALVRQYGLHSPEVLYPGAVLRVDQQVASGSAVLRMQPNGNLVLRHAGAVRWHAYTDGNVGAAAVLQPNGNLVVRAADGRALWSFGTHLLSNAAEGTYLQVLHGDVYVSSTLGDDVWHDWKQLYQGYDWLRYNRALEPGQSLRSLDGRSTLTMQTNGTLALKVDGQLRWHSGVFGTGNRAVLLRTGQLQVRSATGVVRWSSGTTVTGSFLGLFGEDGLYYVADEDDQPTGEVLAIVEVNSGELSWAR
uniref:hypothetical protein n=1 Tax=Aquipuribacter sp. SD81 TaxID=3127703 RepID=UPI00301A478D